MKVLIINLPISKDRLIFQKEQLKSLGLSFDTIIATSSESLCTEQINMRSLGWERPLRTVETACFLSHQSAWERVAEANEPMLILEDDALLSIHTKSILESLEARSNIDLVTLEVRGRKKIISETNEMIYSEYKLYKLYQDRTGAAGYILWPSGARKLLKKAGNSSPALADAFISSCYSLSAFQVEPAVIIQLDQCKAYGVDSTLETHSTISNHQKPETKQLSLSTTLGFKAKRIKSQIRMGMRHLSVLFISRKRYIKLVNDHFVIK